MKMRINFWCGVTFLILVLLNQSVSAQHWKSQFNKTEKKELRKCKGTLMAFYHHRQMKEFTRLMNLSRTNPTLLKKYIHARYGDSYVELIPWQPIEKSFSRNHKRVGLLRPSITLHVGAFYHAFGGGLKGLIGHQYFYERLIASLTSIPFYRVLYQVKIANTDHARLSIFLKT